MNNRFTRTSLLVLAALILVPVVAFAAPEPGKAISDWGMAQLKPLMILGFAVAALMLGVMRKFTQLIGLCLFAGMVGLFVYQGDWVITTTQEFAKLLLGG